MDRKSRCDIKHYNQRCYGLTCGVNHRKRRSFLEKSGTFTNSERRIQRVNQVVEPLEGTKPDGQIVVDIMNRMGYEQAG
jgi:hypothetical protein